MKTPIPKKPWNHQSIKLSSTLAGQREQLREHHNLFCALIDVLTEQQKRLDAIEKYNREVNYCTCKGYTVDRQGYCGNCGKKPEPYTAMRSTGELSKEELDIMQKEYTDFLNKKDIKPREDVTEKVINHIHEWKLSRRTCKDLIEELLSIVKGE